MLITGIFNLGGAGCSVFVSSFSSSSFAGCVSAGRSRSLGGMTMGLYAGTRAVGTFRVILGRSKDLGRLGVGTSMGIKA